MEGYLYAVVVSLFFRFPVLDLVQPVAERLRVFIAARAGDDGLGAEHDGRAVDGRVRGVVAVVIGGCEVALYEERALVAAHAARGSRRAEKLAVDLYHAFLCDADMVARIFFQLFLVVVAAFFV